MIATAYVRLTPMLLLAAAATACNPAQSPQEAARTPGMPDASETVSTERAIEPPYVAAPPPIAPRTEAATPVSPAPQTGQAGEVPVTLSEYRIDMPATLPAGPTTFRLMNTGTTEHSFEMEGAGLERRLDTLLKPGENRPLTVDLKPGTYKVYCPVGTHSDQGMALTLTVTEGAQPATAP